jgi:hypothetical protein
MTIRWVFTDPHDTNSNTRTWTVPRNPAEMTSPLPPRNISSSGTVSGAILAQEGAAGGYQWSFKGRLVNRAHYDNLILWKNRQNRFTITDHFGRVITVLPVKLDHTPKNTPHNYWNGDYEFTCLVVSVSAPTQSDIWS